MDANPWDWPPEEIQRVGHRVVDLIVDYLQQFPQGPVHRPFPTALAAEFRDTPVPVEGQSVEEILGEFAQKIAPYPFGNGHPRYWAWVNSPPSPIGIFADALAATMNPSCAGGNHAAIHLEHQVIRWFQQWTGFPATSMGLLVSGGSMATLTALAAARHVNAGVDVRGDGIQGLSQRLVVYASTEAHSCVRKAVELLGLGSKSLNLIPVDAAYRMQISLLEDAIRTDLQAGRRPIAVVASAGTVNTGAIDPLHEIRRICDRHGLWLHVDGAYGGPAILTERYRAALAGLAEADSLALDPHKWLCVPVEAGLVLVRNADALRDTFSLVPPYLRLEKKPGGFAGDLPWFSEHGLQLTRGFRALKVWMCVRHHGTRGYAKAIDHDLDLAEHLAAKVRASRDLQLMASPSLSIVCFRYAPADWRGDGPRLDALNQGLLEKIQMGGAAFLSSTELNDRFVLRACIVNPHSTTADIEFLVDHVEALGRSMAS